MFKRCFLIISVLLVASGNAIAQSDALTQKSKWLHWECSNHTQVLWRFSNANKSVLDIRLAAGDIAYRLKQMQSASGVMYSNEMFTFFMHGNEGILYKTATHKIIAKDCQPISSL